MSDANIEWLWDARDVLRYSLYVWYSCYGRRSCVVVSFGSSSRSLSVTLHFFRPLSKLYVSVLFVKVVVECVDFESIINVA